MRHLSDEIEHKLWQLIDGSLPKEEAEVLLRTLASDQVLRKQYESMKALHVMLNKEINKKVDHQLVTRAVNLVKEESTLATNSMKVMLWVMLLMLTVGVTGLLVTDGSGFGLDLESAFHLEWSRFAIFSYITPMMAYSGMTILSAMIFVFFYERRSRPI